MRAMLVCALFAAPTAGKEPPDIVPLAASAGKFQSLVNALVAADLTGALAGDGPFTVFTPTDNAFENLPGGTLAKLLKAENKAQLQAILKYHVVPGWFDAKELARAGTLKTLNGATLTAKPAGHKLKVGGATVVKADIACRNGIVHVIDAVLMPAADRTTLVDVVASAGKFRTLIAAAKAAGLVETLSSDGPLTVFAPTDEAFDKLPLGTVESLLRPENREKLKQILAYHVVPGRLSLRELVAAENPKTLQGGRVAVAIRDGRVTIDAAQVVASDVRADNGTIQVIDAVLMPKDR